MYLCGRVAKVIESAILVSISKTCIRADNSTKPARKAACVVIILFSLFI